MSEPQKQPYQPEPATLTWFGISAGGAALAWLLSSVLLVLAHRSDGAGPAAIGVCVGAATLTVVAAIVGSRYKEQSSIAGAVADVSAENLEEHRQIIASVQQLQLRMARLEAGIERLLKTVPDAIEQSRWHGRADVLEDLGDGRVIQIGDRRK